MKIFQGDGDVVIFTPLEYSSILQELTKDYSITIVNYNIEVVFDNLLKEMSKIIDRDLAIEILERILCPHYVNIAVDNGMINSDLVVFISNDFNGDIDGIDISTINDFKVFLDHKGDYDDKFMDEIIQKGDSKEYINGDVIIAHRDLWNILMASLSILEYQVRNRGLIGTLEDLLVIARESNKEMFGEIVWKL